MTAPSSRNCVVSGLVLKVKHDSASIILNRKRNVALLINGNITETFVHKGVNISLTTQETKSAVDEVSCKFQTWISDTLEVIQNLDVDLLLVSGKVDEKLVSVLNNRKIAVIDHIRAKCLDNISDQLGGCVATYVKDCDHTNVVCLDVEIDKCIGFATNSLDYWARVWLPTAIQTVIICHSVSSFASEMEHYFWHQAHRLSSVSKTDKMLPGRCETEKFVVSHLESLKVSGDEFRFAACNILCQGFNNFINTAERNINCCERPSVTVFDDYESKINGWKSALRMACLLSRVDYVINVSEPNAIEQFSTNLSLGQL